MENTARPPMVKMVKNLFLGLPEVGKIKIGGKGEQRTSQSGNTYQLPEKHDYFTVTNLHRDNSGNFMKNHKIHEMIGEKPRAIKVRLVSDQMEYNLQVRYARYNGKILSCSGDGEIANELQEDGSYQQVQCPCQRLDQGYQGKDKCKINGTLNVIIDGIDQVGGVWKFRTTSFNSVTSIISSIQMILSMTGGRVAGLPLTLILNPKTTTTPDGKTTTVYVVGLVYRGTVENLLDASYKQAKMFSAYQNKLQLLGPAPIDPPAPEDYSTPDFDGESDFSSPDIQEQASSSSLEERLADEPEPIYNTQDEHIEPIQGEIVEDSRDSSGGGYDPIPDDF